MEWSEARRLTGKPNPYVGEILDAGFLNAQAVLVLFTPDDEARLIEHFIKADDELHEKQLTPQPRQNVTFEARMAMGKFPERTVLVQIGKVRPMSDISGLHILRLDGSTKSRQDLAERLKNAGCAVKIENRTDWHTVGNFELKVLAPKQETINETSRPNLICLGAEKIWVELKDGKIIRQIPQNSPITDASKQAHLALFCNEPSDIGKNGSLQNQGFPIKNYPT